MPQGLRRFYGCRHLHFITFSCYQRLPLLGAPEARNFLLQILAETRQRLVFTLAGYVVMPEHVHLLIGEPEIGNPSKVVQILKQRVSCTLRKNSVGALNPAIRSFWHTRFYDFNIWSLKKKNEKLHYLHFNPVKRGLVENPEDWEWSSYRFYSLGEKSLCTPNPTR
ncbi:MAG TPA: transposase [Verrucomicrobiae bacterium]|nr:transposase [Verrucomicrobiae bacterium]